MSDSNDPRYGEERDQYDPSGRHEIDPEQYAREMADQMPEPTMGDYLQFLLLFGSLVIGVALPALAFYFVGFQVSLMAGVTAFLWFRFVELVF